MRIRIVSVPPSEAPLSIRRAWVGITLPLADGTLGPVKLRQFGVRSGPRSLASFWLRWLLRGGERTNGFIVDAAEAIALLAEEDPDAAAWWRENAQHMLQPWMRFSFEADVCKIIAHTGDLLAVVLETARRSLTRWGCFYPFGAAISNDGEFHHQDADDGSHYELPPPEEAAKYVIHQLARQAALGAIRASAICIDTSDFAGAPSDPQAVQVHLEDSSDNSIQFHVRYRKRFPGSITYDSRSSSVVPPQVFV